MKTKNKKPDTGETRTLDEIISGITSRLEAKRDKEAAELEKEGFTAEVIDKVRKEHDQLIEDVERAADASQAGKQRLPKGRGVAATRLIEQAQLKLLEREQRGDFTRFPITPGCEYPSIFTRVPLFAPTKRGTAKAMLDNDGAITFTTGWGEGRKFGPPLTIYDEDTLLALGALRQAQLVGMGSRMPVEVMNPFDPAEETSVQVLYTTISEIEEYLCKSRGGRGHKKRLQSVKRLAAATIEFTRISDPSTESAIKRRSFNTKIIDMLTEELKTDSCLFIQFPPVMVKWLKESYTYIDMDIRRQLSDNGKAIHKFLAGQSVFNISAEKLHTLTGTALPMNRFLQALRETLKKLEELGWLEYELAGNGRRIPYVLTGHRLKKTSKKSGN